MDEICSLGQTEAVRIFTDIFILILQANAYKLIISYVS